MVRHAKWQETAGRDGLLQRAEWISSFIGASAFALVGFVACCGIGKLPGFVVGWALTQKEMTRRRLERLRDSPTRYGQHACRLTLEWSGLVYGRDEGLVSFVDGTVLYEGRQTTFSATRSHVILSQFSALEFGFGEGPFYCRLWPLNRKEFAAAVEKWIEEVPADIEYAVLPPIRAQPRIGQAAATLAAAARITGSVGLVLTILLFALAEPAVAIIAASFMFGIVVCLVLSSNEIRRTIRSLEQYSSRAARRPTAALNKDE